MTITRNYTGHRVGECHQKAKLSDAQVRNMRVARERLGCTYRQIAATFLCSIWTARDICTYRTRASA